VVGLEDEALVTESMVVGATEAVTLLVTVNSVVLGNTVVVKLLELEVELEVPTTDELVDETGELGLSVIDG